MSLEDKVILDRFFTVPIGAEDEFVKKDQLTDGELDYLAGIDEIDGYVYDEEEDSDDTEGAAMGVPENFKVVSQKTRTIAGGQQVVDVVFTIDDVAGAVDYEVRIVKT